MSVVASSKEELVTITRKEYDQLTGLAAQLAELQRMVFGRKSERFFASDDHQISLFDNNPTPVESDPVTEQVSYKPLQEKQKPVRAILPADLPRQEEVIESQELEGGMKKIGEEVTKILEHIPGKPYVRRIPSFSGVLDSL